MFLRTRLFSIFKKVKNFKPPPKPPNDWECCRDECRHCVWTTYFEDLKKHKENKKKNEGWGNPTIDLE